MTRLMDRPISLLLWVGLLLGVTFPLGKIAMASGVTPLVWAMVVSAGASLGLVPLGLRRRVLKVPRGQALRYVVISGLVSFAGINMLIFGLIPKIGAGQVGMMFALSPVATLALSVLVGLRGPGRLGALGIGFGMTGALMVAWGQGGANEGTLIWSFVAFLLPVVLALGNVYRTLDWPDGVDPIALAIWSHLAAIVALFALQLGLSGTLHLAPLADVWEIATLQAVSAALTFPAYFRLQKLGGPVLLSQIGYVAAAVGLVAAILVLGERFGLMVWSGAGVIALGIALTILAQTGKRLSWPSVIPARRKRARVALLRPDR